jgi:hypothetical protein
MEIRYYQIVKMVINKPLRSTVGKFGTWSTHKDYNLYLRRITPSVVNCSPWRASKGHPLVLRCFVRSNLKDYWSGTNLKWNYYQTTSYRRNWVVEVEGVHAL